MKKLVLLIAIGASVGTYYYLQPSTEPTPKVQKKLVKKKTRRAVRKAKPSVETSSPKQEIKQLVEKSIQSQIGTLRYCFIRLQKRPSNDLVVDFSWNGKSKKPKIKIVSPQMSKPLRDCVASSLKNVQVAGKFSYRSKLRFK